MADPMTSTQLLRQLKKWGVNYREYENWETHNRNHKGKWGPVHGFAWHHTGSDNKDQRILLRKGYSGLPGPLSHFGIAQDGICWLIGWGRANHAGLGDDDVLDALIRERNLPVDNEANTDGNARLYGAEFWYSGNHAMTTAQYETGILLSCAIFDFHDWKGESALGHGEWQPGKWDPGIRKGELMDMDRVRRDINDRLKKGPKPVANSDGKSQTYKDVWETDAMQKPFFKDASEPNSYWWPGSILKYAAEQSVEANRKLDRIMKHLGLD